MIKIACAIIVAFLVGSISCKKGDLLFSSGEAQWIKVVSDSTVFFPGKIRVDGENNLYCSYDHKEPEISRNSGLIKLDINGDLVWRKQFDSVAIFDFLVKTDGIVIIASASAGIVTLREIPATADTCFILGSYDLPSFGKPVVKVLGMKILKDETKNTYILSGTARLNSQTSDNSAGFMMEMSATGMGIWRHSYIFEQSAGAATAITGCTQTSDGFMLFGNLQFGFPTISKFFILKCNLNNGDTLWSRFYNTSSYFPDSQPYDGYYCSTSDIVAGDDGYFYAGAFNVLYNTPSQTFPIHTNDDNSARIFKINATGETIDSIHVKFDIQNAVADLVKKKDGGLLIGLNPYKLGNFAFVGKRNSFVANVNSSFVLENVTTIQTQYSDYLGSICSMPDGHYAIVTTIQSLGQANNNLEIIKTDLDGNF